MYFFPYPQHFPLFPTLERLTYLFNFKVRGVILKLLQNNSSLATAMGYGLDG
jgi:hypothetical protein